MRRIAMLICVVWPSGCGSPEAVAPWVNRRGDVSVAAAPAILETYVIEGSIRAAGPTGEPVANAIVCAFSAGHFYGRCSSDGQGRFRLTGDAGRAPSVVEVGSNVRSAETAKLPAPKVVEHSFVSLRAHPHYLVEIVVRHPRYAPSRAQLEVPRDTRAPPMEFLLVDGKPEAATEPDASCQQEEHGREASGNELEGSP